jgi:hypothetical protein
VVNKTEKGMRILPGKNMVWGENKIPIYVFKAF